MVGAGDTVGCGKGCIVGVNVGSLVALGAGEGTREASLVVGADVTVGAGDTVGWCVTVGALDTVGTGDNEGSQVTGVGAGTGSAAVGSPVGDIEMVGTGVVVGDGVGLCDMLGAGLGSGVGLGHCARFDFPANMMLRPLPDEPVIPKVIMKLDCSITITSIDRATWSIGK